MKKIKKTFSVWFADEPKTPLAKGIYIFIVGLILYSATAFIVHLMQPKYYEYHSSFFILMERIIVGVFSIEYLIRLWVNKNKRRFVSNIYNIIDLIAIIPSYFAALNFTILRTVRFIRIVRMFRLLRLQRMIITNNIIKENIIKNVLVVFTIVLVEKPLHDFITSIPKTVLGDMLFASSILALAAMFGTFSYSYRDININKTLERIFAHLTTGMLMLPIGIMFLIIQFVLNLEIGYSSPFVVISIWFVYASIVLWDFANSLRARSS